MRLGGPVFYEGEDPEEFVRIHTLKGYRAALCPQNLKAGQTQKIQAYRAAAVRKDLIYAEVGAWCNPLSEDPKEAGQARERIIERLSLAEELGARACVNVIGTRCPDNWYGPDEKNYSEDFFAEAVSVYRSVIDAVRPKRTRMTFEMMPYSFLDCAQEYLRFLKALDRPEAGVHLDLVNCINSPRRYFANREWITETFRIFAGVPICSVHLKDIRLECQPVSTVFTEVPIGEGAVHFPTLLKELAKLPEDTPVLLEHLREERAYDLAAARVRAYLKEIEI